MTQARKANKNGSAARLGFEEKLWVAADKMHSYMDPAEYKHVVLGLIFLKYISDAFEEKREQLSLFTVDPSSDLYVREPELRYEVLEDRDEYLADAPTPTGQARKALLRAWGGKGATFGDWFFTLDRTVPFVDEVRGPLYYSTKQLLGTKENPTSFRQDMLWLMDRRNELHHSNLPVGDEADELVQEVAKRFERCVSETAPVWQHPLRLVLDYDAVRGSEYVLATCLDYTGNHPAGRKVQEQYRGIPKKQDLYILQNGEEWISLYPLISIHYCRHCQARETYFIDGWAGLSEDADLISFERAHRETSQEIGQELTKWLSSES